MGSKVIDPYAFFLIFWVYMHLFYFIFDIFLLQ